MAIAEEQDVIGGREGGKSPRQGNRLEKCGAALDRVLPGTLDLSVVDRVELATDDESVEMARRLAAEEGILSGISCGAAVAVAVRVAREPEMEGKTMVVILPDSGERYLSTILFEGLFD